MIPSSPKTRLGSTFVVLLGMAGLILASPLYAQSRGGAERNDATPLTPETFAFHIQLGGMPGDLLSYPLPSEVYLGSRRADLGDLGVFDNAGKPAPFMVREEDDERQSVTHNLAIPFFPWEKKAENQDRETPTPSPVDIEIGINGAIIRIKGQDSRPPSIDQATPKTWLLDLAPLNQATADAHKTVSEVRTLRLDTKPDAYYSSVVNLRASSDLVHWRHVGSGEAIARMKHGDDILERNEINLPPNIGRYLLLEMDGDLVPVTRIQAESTLVNRTSVRRKMEIEGTLSTDGRRVLYDLGGSFPIVSIGFELPQSEIMSVRLFGQNRGAGAATASPYPDLSQNNKNDLCRDMVHPVASGVIYNLPQNGVRLKSEPFSIQSSCRYWVLKAKGDIPFVVAPAMLVEWKPSELLFLARGSGPWILAFGRREAVRQPDLPLGSFNAAKPARLIADLPDIEPAKPTTAFRDPTPISAAGYALWGVLGGSILLLAIITLVIARQVRKTGKEKQDD